jgi:hypothetical protein
MKKSKPVSRISVDQKPAETGPGNSAKVDTNQEQKKDESLVLCGAHYYVKTEWGLRDPGLPDSAYA